MISKLPDDAPPYPQFSDFWDGPNYASIADPQNPARARAIALEAWRRGVQDGARYVGDQFIVRAKIQTGLMRTTFLMTVMLFLFVIVQTVTVWQGWNCG